MSVEYAVLLALLFLAALPASGEPDAVTLLPGETALSDIGVYQVSYQSYGGEQVDMPPSWTGHFEPTSGISYSPAEWLLGRPAILLHCPWRVPTGPAWVDYPLQLPEQGPVTLRFGIAMLPEVAVPDKSDGVTFSAAVVHRDTTEELLRVHYDKGEWRDHTFDLSRYAGERITLRLQTEPGPENSPSFDYSYFGGATITCGEGTEARAALIERITGSRAYKATDSVSLVRLSNASGQGIAPSNLLDYQNAVRKAGDGFEFVYQAADADITYTYEPRTGTLDDLRVRVDGGTPFRPAGGGAINFGEAARNAPASLISADVGGGKVRAVWEYALPGNPVRATWTFGVQAKALTVEVSCDEPVVEGFSLGNVADAPLRRTITIPYLPADWSRGSVDWLPANLLFVGRYLDWTRTGSSRSPQGSSVYEPKTDGTRNPLFETGYVCVSPNVNEVFPNIPWEPSEYLELLGDRVMLDIWGHYKGTYQGDAENLRNLKDNGVDHLAIISHDWQCYGYDVKLPDHLPANARYGGDEGMVEFGKAANDCGYVWSLHENYIDLYPDAPSYDPAARVLLADGEPSKAWFNAGTGVQSYGLKCNRALGYAKQNAPEIHRRFGTNAAYLDVHTCVPPWHQLDHEANQPMAAMCRAKVIHDAELFDYMRETHEGPLFGEGHNHFYWAGQVDGVEAQVAGGENHVPYLDFDLLKIHPQMVNHGMGYYERWFTRGYNHQWGMDTGAPWQVDKYRAQELAYGHAGFIGSAQTANVQWVAKEHHLMHAVQRLTGASRPTRISYEVDGQLVSGSAALAANDRMRQKIEYETGLTLWVNWAEGPWQIEGRTLPQWGFLALGPGTEVCTVVDGGKFADFARCPEYLFADARTYFHMPYVAENDIQPRLRSFEYLGGDKIRLTYEWRVNETLDRDPISFVHFTNPSAGGNQGIVFQNDHGFGKPVRDWKPGDVIVDGPHDVTVADEPWERYAIVAGLYDSKGRVALKGPVAGERAYLLGELRVTRRDGQIVNVELADFEEAVKRYAAVRADFSAHTNPPGTMVDFGVIATDGSVKINLAQDGLTVFPYPRDREFTVVIDPKKAVANGAIDLARITVRALAAGTAEDMGIVPHRIENGRVVFEAGQPGAGRFRVTW